MAMATSSLCILPSQACIVQTVCKKFIYSEVITTSDVMGTGVLLGSTVTDQSNLYYTKGSWNVQNGSPKVHI